MLGDKSGISSILKQKIEGKKLKERYIYVVYSPMNRQLSSSQVRYWHCFVFFTSQFHLLLPLVFHVKANLCSPTTCLRVWTSEACQFPKLLSSLPRISRPLHCHVHPQSPRCVSACSLSTILVSPISKFKVVSALITPQ